MASETITIVEIQDPEDGRVSHEIGPFPDTKAAASWRIRFLERTGYDESFIEVREIIRKLYNPASHADMQEIDTFYGYDFND